MGLSTGRATRSEIEGFSSSRRRACDTFLHDVAFVLCSCPFEILLFVSYDGFEEQMNIKLAGLAVILSGTAAVV